MCCGCDELEVGEDCMKVVTAGSVMTQPCACFTFMITAFHIVNYGLVIADLYYGAKSIIETDTQIAELTPIIAANLTDYLKADVYHDESIYSPETPWSTDLMLWKVSLGLLGYYALAEAVMLFHILFGFKMCCKKIRSHYEAPNDHILGHVVVGLMDILENILVSAMSYGQLIFAHSTPINRYIFVNGVSAAETTGLVLATAAVTHVLNNIRLISDVVRFKKASEATSEKRWRIKFLLHIVELLSSGFALAFTVNVRIVARELQFEFLSFNSNVFLTTGKLALLSCLGPVVFVGILFCMRKWEQIICG